MSDHQATGASAGADMARGGAAIAWRGGGGGHAPASGADPLRAAAAEAWAHGPVDAGLGKATGRAQRGAGASDGAADSGGRGSRGGSAAWKVCGRHVGWSRWWRRRCSRVQQRGVRSMWPARHLEPLMAAGAAAECSGAAYSACGRHVRWSH